MNNERAKTIERIINRHERGYISLYTNKNLKKSLMSVHYGKCKCYLNDITNNWVIDFSVEGRHIASFKLNEIEYDFTHHELYLKN